MSEAPLYARIAEAPEGGCARWVEAADGVRLRIAWWNAGDAGTVLIFPGRTEFIEKYGRTIAAFVARGFSAAAIDWRGQGLSDRLAPNRKLGHVGRFADYQLDVEAFTAALRAVPLPEPFHLCAHSMGGTIGLRALIRGLDVDRSLFSAPMWGLTIDPLWRPLVQAAAAGGDAVGLGKEYAPGTGPDNYLQSHGFEGNSLTSSAESWEYMQRQIRAHPGLTIGGPSVHWLSEAMAETRALMALPPPRVHALCLIGSDEQVVDKRDVQGYMERWPHGHLGIVSGARHEILMETPEIRRRAHDMIDLFYRERDAGQ